MNYEFTDINGTIVAKHIHAKLPSFIIRRESILGITTVGSSDDYFTVHVLTPAELIKFTAKEDDVLSLISIMGW